MGGYSPTKTKASLAARQWQGEEDPCDLRFTLELMGFRPEASEGLHDGAILEVALVERSNASSVVCRLTPDVVIGALAAFRGLAQLINCLRQGARFRAVIRTISATRCEVEVERSE